MNWPKSGIYGLKKVIQKIYLMVKWGISILVDFDSPKPKFLKSDGQ